MGQATELHDLLSPVCAPAVPDLVSPRLPTLSKSHRLWVGLLGRLGGARVRMSQRALGGARPLISQAVLGEGVALERPPPPSWGGSRQGQKGFSGSSPPTGGKGPGRPRAGWVCDGAGGTPARTGPTNPRLHSRRARLPAARLARGGGARTPGRAAVTGQKPRRGAGGGGPPVGGTTSEPPGSGRRRPRLGVGGRGQGRHPLSQSCPLFCVTWTWTWTVQQPRPALRPVHLHVLSM